MHVKLRSMMEPDWMIKLPRDLLRAVWLVEDLVGHARTPNVHSTLNLFLVEVSVSFPIFPVYSPGFIFKVVW